VVELKKMEQKQMRGWCVNLLTCCLRNMILLLQRDDFVLFEQPWSAGEEIRLLDAVAECGFGNW